MIFLPICNLTEGMIVAKPIVVQGKVLLSIGSQLTSKHLQIFKAWGVTDVWVEGDEGECESEESMCIEDEELRPIRDSVEERFKMCDKFDAVICELKRIAIMREYVMNENFRKSQGSERE